MSHSGVMALTQSESLAVTEFAQLVAFRWDLVPWGIVVDINYFVKETSRDQRRGWLVFHGVSDVSWALEEARLPNGVVLSGPIRQQSGVGGFREYRIPYLAPKFDKSGHIINNPHREIQIVAQCLEGLASSSTKSVENSWIDYYQRNMLASDSVLLRAVNTTINQPDT